MRTVAARFPETAEDSDLLEEAIMFVGIGCWRWCLVREVTGSKMEGSIR